MFMCDCTVAYAPTSNTAQKEIVETKAESKKCKIKVSSPSRLIVTQHINPELFELADSRPAIWTDEYHDLSTAPASEEAKNKAISVINEIITPDMTDREKIEAVYDYIVLHTEYDYSLNKDYTYIAEGPILYGYGTCSGYAAAFKCYMDLLGIENTVLVSEGLRHCWNQVVIDGIPYELDATYTDVNKKGVSHELFLIDKDTMIKKHVLYIYGSYDAEVDPADIKPAFVDASEMPEYYSNY